MCNVCSLEKKTLGQVSGVKGRMTKRKLYRAYSKKVANLILCYVHDIELHITGEERFLNNHLLLAKDLVQNSQKYMGKTKKDNDFY